MKHEGFILLDALVCGVLMTLFLLFLLQFYGSSVLTMNHANILHQGLNLAEGIAAGKTVSSDGYSISSEVSDCQIITVKYNAQNLLNIFQAP